MSFPQGSPGLDRAITVLRTRVPDIIEEHKASLLAETLPTLRQGVAGPDGSKEDPQGSRASSPMVSMTLRGLHSMQEQASKASVLYAAPVDDEGILQKLCEQIRAAFQQEGLMDDDHRALLLHATIVNTIYVKGGRVHGRRKERLTIDARAMMDCYDDFVWMEDVPIEKVSICRMGAKRQDDGDEAYEVEAEADVTGPLSVSDII